jgi:hypothetical protein
MRAANLRNSTLDFDFILGVTPHASQSTAHGGIHATTHASCPTHLPCASLRQPMARRRMR